MNWFGVATGIKVIQKFLIKNLKYIKTKKKKKEKNKEKKTKRGET